MSNVLVDAKRFGKQSPLIDTKQAAGFLQVSPGTLDVWRSTRRYRLPFVKVGRNVRYRISDLETFLNERTMNVTEPVSRKKSVRVGKRVLIPDGEIQRVNAEGCGKHVSK